MPIPACEQLRDDERLTRRMYDIMVSCVSTSKVRRGAAREMVRTVGISKRSVLRQFVKANKKNLTN
ncbi:MAG: hypothetical protein VB142_00750 [Burkholderia sp.]